MVFENLNYSTEEKIDEESIQDKIDDKRLDISSLTKENLQKLKVDILQKNSYLKVRDVKWNIISDLKLRDNNVVNFNGDNITHEVNSKIKVFLGVTFEDWKTWYVSADYLKWEKVETTLSKPNIVDWKNSKQEKQINKPQVIGDKKGEREKLTEWKKEANKVNVKESNEKDREKLKTVWYTKDGKNYIVWDNWEAKLLTYNNISPEYKKSLEWFKELSNKVENLNLLLNALTERNSENKKYSWYLQDVLAQFNPNNLNKSNAFIEGGIKEIFWSLEIDNKWDINLNDRVSVLKYIRDELDNYELVRKEIVDKQFNDETRLSDKQIQELIENPSISHNEIEKLVWEEKFKEIQIKIVEKKAEAENYFIRYKKELLTNNTNLSENDLKDLIINAFVTNFAKTVILENFIDKNQASYAWWYNWTNKEIELFSDIQWIWALDISDKNANIGWESFKMIATEIVALAAWTLTAWIWAAWVNALVYWVRWSKYITWINKLQEWANIANSSLKWVSALEKSQIIWTKLGRFAAMSWIEWSAFYAWYGAAQTWIEWKNMYSLEWLGESIAFMWAFKWLNSIYKALWKELKAWVPLSQQKVLLTSQLLAEWTVFSWLGLWFDWKLEPGEWTAETIIQAFLMAWLFKGGWRLMENMRIKRSGENDVVLEEKVENIEWLWTSPVEFYKNKTTWENKSANMADILWIGNWKYPYEWKWSPNKEWKKAWKNWNNTNTEAETWKTEENAEKKETSNINYPKNAEFSIIDKNNYKYNLKTWEKWEILNITTNWKEINPEKYTQILENCNSKNIKFYTNKSGQLVYEADGVLYTKNWNKSKAKKENLKELDGGEKVSESVKEEEASKTEEKNEEVGKTEEKTEKLKTNENNAKVDESKAEDVKSEESKGEETKEEFKAEEWLTKEQIKLKKSLLKNIENIINKEISSIKNWESKNIWTYKIEKSKNWKEYNISNANEELWNKVNLNEVKEIIRKDIKINDNLYKFINELNNKWIDEKLEKLKWKNIEDNLYYSKTNKWEFVDWFWKKIDIDSLPKETQFKILKDITWFDYRLFIKSYIEKFFKSLSKEWKEKFKKLWWWEWLMKDIKTIFVFPFKLTGYGLWKWMTVSTSFNVLKMHRNLNWKDKIVWWLVASTIYESMWTVQNDNESFYDSKHLANIGVNSLNMATFWGLVYFTEPLMNTIYWRFKDFEPRDFLPAYIDNLIGGWTFTWREMPYELWESLLLTDKEILENTIKGFKDAAKKEETIVNPELLNKLEKRLKEVS